MDHTLEQAKRLDAEDKLGPFRDKFIIPRKLPSPCIYFTGNSLGLQPVLTREYLNQELEAWADYGVEGHFLGRHPWFHYHKLFPEKIAKLVGAQVDEVVVMNTLTANLHFLMVSFYRPNSSRYRILTEGGNFPSDYYALETQAKFHGFDFEDAVLELFPREGEDHLRTEDILQAIMDCGDSLALVMMSGVNYYTGQKFQMEEITRTAHSVGALAGFDLAHAIGNVELKLHEWNVDFAVWCSYKYLNSGPGGPGGLYIHERHGNDPETPRFAGWWGHDEEERFQMKKGYIPMKGAPGWQLSNAQVFGMAAHLASLDLFEEAGIENLIDKSKKMIAFLNGLLENVNLSVNGNSFKVLTPEGVDDRGCQFSMVIEKNGKKVFEYLSKEGVVADWREPDVIRIAPVPFYNTFQDLYMFSQLFKKALEDVN